VSDPFWVGVLRPVRDASVGVLGAERSGAPQVWAGESLESFFER